MKKFMFILGILALAASCTPESIGENDQNLDKAKYEIPING